MNRRWIHAGGLALVTLAIVWLAGEASIAALMLAGGGGLLVAVLGAAPRILLVLSWLLWAVRRYGWAWGLAISSGLAAVLVSVFILG